jgi:hypothetical protein
MGLKGFDGALLLARQSALALCESAKGKVRARKRERELERERESGRKRADLTSPSHFS